MLHFTSSDTASVWKQFFKLFIKLFSFQSLGIVHPFTSFCITPHYTKMTIDAPCVDAMIAKLLIYTTKSTEITKHGVYVEDQQQQNR